MDDLRVGSPGPEEHLRVLEEVFFRMKQMGLQTNPDEAQLRQKEVKYLGYNVRGTNLSTKLCGESVYPVAPDIV